MPEVSIFGKDPRICLIGPSSSRRTCEIGTTVSPVSTRADRAAAVYITHPYLWNRSPAWVTIWSRGIGPSTATLRPARLFTSFITDTSGACRHRTARCKGLWSPATAPLIRPLLRDHPHYVSCQPPRAHGAGALIVSPSRAVPAGDDPSVVGDDAAVIEERVDMVPGRQQRADVAVQHKVRAVTALDG